MTNAAAGELLYLAINNGHDSAVGNPLADYIGGSWIAPNNMSWVLLDKQVGASASLLRARRCACAGAALNVAPLVRRAQVINDAEEWNMDLIYHSTDVVPGIYKVVWLCSMRMLRCRTASPRVCLMSPRGWRVQVTVIIASSIVTYWDSGDWESAWMLCGIFGGWLYFMYVAPACDLCA